MKTNLSRYIKQERLKRGLNFAELSQKMGYTNVNRGMRRIIDLEREGVVHHEILEKIIDVLELDREKIDQFIQQDKEQQQREFIEWINIPIKWHLIIRWMPTIYGERDIPGNIRTEEEAIEYAVGVAKELKRMVWLVLSRKENIHVDSDGNIISRNVEAIDCSWLPGASLQ